jgi:hypothetical protein
LFNGLEIVLILFLHPSTDIMINVQKKVHVIQPSCFSGKLRFASTHAVQGGKGTLKLLYCVTMNQFSWVEHGEEPKMLKIISTEANELWLENIIIPWSNGINLLRSSIDNYVLEPSSNA